MDALDRFVAAREESGRVIRGRDAAAVLGDVNVHSPALGPWGRARDFFVSCTHLDRHYSIDDAIETSPIANIVMGHACTVEAALRVRLGQFFDSYLEIEDVVSSANQMAAEQTDGIGRYRIPDDTEVTAALSRLGKLPLRRAFYSTLENPNWVIPLFKNGAFKNPPETSVMPDGLVRSDPWSEIDYLVRMAPIVSKEVTEVFEDIAGLDNQWLRRGIMEAASQLIPADAAKLVPFIKEWPKNKLANFRIHPNDIVRLIVRLLENGQHSVGSSLADVYFEPRPAEQTTKFRLPEPAAGLEAYWYAVNLPAVARALGERSRIPTLLRWLRKHEEYSRSDKKKPLYDTSHIWRPFIREPEEHNVHEIADALVDATRDALIDEAKSSGDRLAGLIDDKEPLLRRIALYALAVAIAETEDKTLDSALTDREKCLAKVAAKVLGNEEFLEGEYYNEYLPFLQASLAWPRGVDPDLIVSVIEVGPPWTKDERRERIAKHSEDPDEVDANIRRTERRWQQRLLSGLDASLLPKRLSELQTEVDAEYGAYEEDDRLTRGGTFIGPTSPVDVEALSGMTDDDLLRQLLSWHPDKRQWAGPSHEGQSRALTEAVASKPGRLSDRVDELKNLRPIYIKGVVRGWKAAVEAKNPLPWKEILPLCEWVVGLDEDVELESEGDPFDDDKDYRQLKLEVLRLLESALGLGSDEAAHGFEATDAPRIVAMLSVYAENEEPTPEYEAQYGGSNMDPLTLSLNAVRPIAIRALIRFVGQFPSSSAAIDALLVLDQHVGELDPSLAVAAAFGEGAGRLYNSASEWNRDRVPKIFGDAVPTTEWQQVALSTLLSVHRVHAGLLEMVRKSVAVTIEELSGTDLAQGWRSHDRTFPQLVGDWIVSSLVTEDLEPDDELVVAWFNTADATLRGEVLGNLAWQIMRANYVLPAILDRVAELWDQRIEFVRQNPSEAAELTHAYWLGRGGKYAVSWWLPRIEYASSVVEDFSPMGCLMRA